MRYGAFEMFRWHNLVLVVVIALVMLGVDYHQQAQKSGARLVELGFAGYVETIKGRIGTHAADVPLTEQAAPASVKDTSNNTSPDKRANQDITPTQSKAAPTRFKAGGSGIAACTTKGGIKRCRIGDG